MDRRTFLAAAPALMNTAPNALKGATEKHGYTWAEIDKMLARGDVKGKLMRADLPTPALILDLDAFESNVDRMTKHAKANNRALLSARRCLCRRRTPVFQYGEAFADTFRCRRHRR